MSGSSITLTNGLVGARLQALTTLRVQLQVHKIEVVLLTRVALGVQSEFAFEDCWKAVLKMRGYAYVEYDDPELQYAPYSEFREEAMYVWDRLQNQESPVEDDPIRPCTPDDDFDNDEELPWRRYERAFLQEAARLTSCAFRESVFDTQAFIDLLEHEARFAITHRFRETWLDDTYALGAALLDPTMGSSPFGDRKEQSMFARHLALIVVEAAKTCIDANNSDSARNESAERLSLLWPILKGYAMVIAESINSPVATMADSNVVDLVEQALFEGLSAMHAEPERVAHMRTHNSSPDAVRCAETPTTDIVAKLRNRATQEHEMRDALRQMR